MSHSPVPLHILPSLTLDSEKIKYESDEINRRKLVAEVKGLLHTHPRLKSILKMPAIPKDVLRTSLFQRYLKQSRLANVQSVQFSHLMNCTDLLTTRQTLILPITDIKSVTEAHKCETYLVEGPKAVEASPHKRRGSNGVEMVEEIKRTKKVTYIRLCIEKFMVTSTQKQSSLLGMQLPLLPSQVLLLCLFFQAIQILC
jgi:hypothetical protein